MNGEGGADRKGGAACASEPEAVERTTVRQQEERMIQPAVPAGAERDRAVRILAKTIYKELTMNGYEGRQIVALSTELLGLVTSALNAKGT